MRQLHCRMMEQYMSRPYRIFTDTNYAYFVTWTLVDWLHLFDKEPYRQIVLDSLNYLRTEKKTQLNAFVVMSSHLHAMLWPEIGINLSDVTRDFKRFTSRKISQEAEKQSAMDILKVSLVSPKFGNEP
jgi:REP element-mobilizing transposase RayT